MHKLEAMRILEAKLKSVKSSASQNLPRMGLREPIDAKAEALSAFVDFLKTCKECPAIRARILGASCAAEKPSAFASKNNSIPFAVLWCC